MIPLNFELKIIIRRLHEVHIAFLRSAKLLFQGVHTETTGSIPDDGKKYGC
jgi:hypothetical protein